MGIHIYISRKPVPREKKAQMVKMRAQQTKNPIRKHTTNIHTLEERERKFQNVDYLRITIHTHKHFFNSLFYQKNQFIFSVVQNLKFLSITRKQKLNEVLNYILFFSEFFFFSKFCECYHVCARKILFFTASFVSLSCWLLLLMRCAQETYLFKIFLTSRLRFVFDFFSLFFYILITFSTHSLYYDYYYYYYFI